MKRTKETQKGVLLICLTQTEPSLAQNNREYMITILQYHRYFRMQEMAYRGHDETDESPNPGEWKQFIETMLVTNQPKTTVQNI